MKNKNVINKIENIKTVLEEFFDEKCIDKIIDESKELGIKIISECPNYKSKTTDSFMEKGVFALSVYKILLKYIDKEKALQITQKCFCADIDNTFKSPIIKALSKNKSFLRLSRRIMVRDANKHDGNLGFRYELKPMDKKYLYRFNVTKCPLVELLKEYEAVELAPFLCETDFYFMKYYPKNISLIRPKVIGNGDEYCEFNYIIK